MQPRSTTQPDHRQTAINALHRLYRETNTLRDSLRITLDVAALRLMAYADLLAFLEPNRTPQGASEELMLAPLKDWRNQTFDSRAIITKQQQAAERRAIDWIKQNYFTT